MRAALLDLKERSGGRRSVAILGEMAELGAESERYHREIGALLAELGVGALVAVGELARAYMTPGVPEMRWVARVPTGSRRCSSRVTRYSSRRPGQWAWKASPRG